MNKHRKVKPYSELDGRDKEWREKDRKWIKQLEDYNDSERTKMYIFEVEFECPECHQQIRGQIAINRKSPLQTSDTFGFVTHHWLMCNKCYYGL